MAFCQLQFRLPEQFFEGVIVAYLVGIGLPEQWLLYQRYRGIWSKLWLRTLTVHNFVLDSRSATSWHFCGLIDKCNLVFCDCLAFKRGPRSRPEFMVAKTSLRCSGSITLIHCGKAVHSDLVTNCILVDKVYWKPLTLPWNVGPAFMLAQPRQIENFKIFEKNQSRDYHKTLIIFP